MINVILRQFDAITSNTDHLKDAQKAVLEASARVMNNPRRFTKPCMMTALAVAMATPLSVIIRTSIANTIIACVGGKDEQSKVSKRQNNYQFNIKLKCNYCS